MKSRLLSLMMILMLALFAVSCAIAAPILCRPFYYLHVRALDLPARTGWSYEAICEAFDDVMNFIWKGAEFKTGALKWSESGMQHFADCKALFWLDLCLLLLSAAGLAVLLLVGRSVRPHRFLSRGPSFWAGLFILLSFVTITVLGALDFDRAFVVFHRLFFPGKDNWLFDARTDEIILVFPSVYFRDCAILAIALLAVFSAVYMIAGRRRKP